MAEPRHATVSENGVLTLGKAHHVPWIKEFETAKCVVEVQARGLVKIWPLERWAELQELPLTEAEQHLLSASEDLDDELSTRTFLQVAKRKKAPRREEAKQVHSVHEIRLPFMALYALFEPGVGPMTVRKGPPTGVSAAVAVIQRSDHLEIRGREQI
jgi:hypothetical protein